MAAQLPSCQEVALSCLRPPSYPTPDLLTPGDLAPFRLVHQPGAQSLACGLGWGLKLQRLPWGKALA